MASSPSSSSVMQVGTLPRFLDQWRSVTSNRIMLNLVKGHNLQIRCSLPLFCNFQQFNIKADIAYHTIIWKKVEELLAKGAIEPLTGGAGLYSNIFLVPKESGGL